MLHLTPPKLKPFQLLYHDSSLETSLVGSSTSNTLNTSSVSSLTEFDLTQPVRDNTIQDDEQKTNESASVTASVTSAVFAANQETKLSESQNTDDTKNEYFIFTCPHCENQVMVYKQEIACGIFRHGMIWNPASKQFENINPHASQAECEQLQQRSGSVGCFKPFRIKQVSVPVVVSSLVTNSSSTTVSSAVSSEASSPIITLQYEIEECDYI